jgi:hypothetical protein
MWQHVNGAPFSERLNALFGWLVASQPAVLFSHTSSAPASSIFLS